MATATGLLRWYYETREAIGAPGLDPVKARGRVYDKRCKGKTMKGKRVVKCRSTNRHFSHERKAWVCGHCGTPWPYVERLALKGEVSETSRSGGYEPASIAWLDLGVQLKALLESEDIAGRLFVANAVGHSVRSLLEQGPETFPEFDDFSWTFRSVRESIGRGRVAWEALLTRAEIEFEAGF